MIRDLEDGHRSICVHDNGFARFYTVKKDEQSPGRWLFAGQSHRTLRAIVSLLYRTPIKNKVRVPSCLRVWRADQR